MTVHLLRFDPDLAQAAKWFAAEGLTPERDEDDGYAWHALLAAAFGKALAPKPFRVLARRGRPPQLLAYSAADAPALKAQAADFADPKVVAALGLATLAGKPMPAFAAGRRLGVSVRLRPIVRTDRDGDRRKSRELDVFVAASRAAGPGQPLDRSAVYLDWTRARFAAAGTEVERLRLDGSDGISVVRRGARTEAGRPLLPIAGQAITVAGTIRVSDSERFASALARGLGRHRAFGYGMLLLSPPED
jgi:CRISPR system Cascade subunit CasE